MTSPEFSIGEDALLAYADGRLEGEQLRAVEAYLSAHPDKAAEVANWLRQNEALHALFDGTAKEPVPGRLSAHRIAHDVKRQSTWRWQMAAAAAVLIVLGGAIGWFGRDYTWPSATPVDRLMTAAVTAHTLYVKEKTHAVEVPADAPNLMTWLSNRIATPIDAPNLTAEGYTFVGGRLLPPAYGDAPGPAAQLMYENASAQRVTLYITAALPDKKEVWEFESRSGVEAYYWANAVVTCTVVGDIPEDDLRMVGKKVFQQLTWRPDSSWKQS
jgi:anti-sigma factor RsiW